MKVDFERFHTPSGEVIEDRVKGTDGHPRSLVIARRIKVSLLLLVVAFVLIFPIAQCFVPRSTNALGERPLPTVSVSLEPVQYSTPTTILVALSPAALSTPTLVPTSSRPQILVNMSGCLALDFPVFGSNPVGEFIPGTVVYPLGRWDNLDGERWYLLDGGWLQPDCSDLSLRGELPFVSPPMRDPPTPTPTLTPTPFPVFPSLGMIVPPTLTSVVVNSLLFPTPTPTPVFKYFPLPSGFSPGWCVAVRRPSVWLLDGSKYDATPDGYTYLSDGVLGQSLVVSTGDWFEDFSPSKCGRYK